MIYRILFFANMPHVVMIEIQQDYIGIGKRLDLVSLPLCAALFTVHGQSRYVFITGTKQQLQSAS